MASKKKNTASNQPKELTRKQQRQSAKDRERTRRVVLGTGIAIGAALFFVLVGIIYEYAYKPNSTLASVGEQKVVTSDYWKRVRLTQNQLQNQLGQYINLEQQFGGQGYFAAQIEQIESTLNNPFTLGMQVLDEMIEEQIVVQEAAARGITVSKEEVDEAIREQVAASQQAITESQATATAAAAVEATATADSWTPTPEPTIDVNSPITETVEQPTSEPVPTLPILDDATFAEGLAELESDIREISGMSLDEYRDIVRTRLLQDKLAEAMGPELVEPFAEEVNARHILLEVQESDSPLAIREMETIEGAPTPAASTAVTSDSTLDDGTRTAEETRELAEELRQRILDGEDFAALAEEYSDDPGSAASGGDLGWFGRNRMVPAFEEAAFTLDVGEISEPVETDFGYHIIEVLDRDEQRPKDEATLEQEQQQAFREWLTAQVLETDIDRPDDIVSSLPSDFEAGLIQMP